MKTFPNSYCPSRPLPFDCTIYDDEPATITNPFSGASCDLEPDAIAVYDTTIGANMFGNYELVRKGVDWFRKYFPEEYYILLD